MVSLIVCGASVMLLERIDGLEIAAWTEARISWCLLVAAVEIVDLSILKTGLVIVDYFCSQGL